MNKRKYILLGGLAIALAGHAQTPRASFGIDGFAFANDLNPAMHPDSSYWSLPVIGNTGVGLSSSMKLGDLLFDKSDGSLTTFMNSNTISKADLMNHVGRGLNGSFGVSLTLASFGRRINDKRYQTISLSWRSQGDGFLDKGLFDVMKEVENRIYTIDKTTVDFSSFMELAYGESRKLGKQWTIGLKAKALLGVIHADATLNNMKIDLSTGKWIAQGIVNANISGLEYKNTVKEYKSYEGTYTMVNSVKLTTPSIRGIGLGIDAGAFYKPDNHWSFSAAVLDLGLIYWFSSHKAENSGEVFEFDGFHDVSSDKDNPRSLKNQWNCISDQLMDMAHLEETGTGSNTRMLSCTINAGATYHYNIYSASLLMTEVIHGRVTAFEGRMNVGITPLKNIDLVVSPAYGTYKFQLGAMFRWHPGRYQVYIGSDNLLNKITHQFLPTSLNSTLNFGMTLPL